MNDEIEESVETRLRAQGLDWIVPDWHARARVQALVTTRNGGASREAYATMNLGRRTDDDPEALAENSRRLAAFLPAPPVWMEQVHGPTVVTLGATPPAVPPVADAAVTREIHVVCAVLVADCLPIIFADRKGAAVGVAHAGWRGLAAGVVEATVSAFAGIGVAPESLIAWIGPGIGPSAFEVGSDVVHAFAATDRDAHNCFTPSHEGKWLADLPALARRRLGAAGVTTVTGGGFCTFRDSARFFSYRRERASGRMAALAWLDGGRV